MPAQAIGGLCAINPGVAEEGVPVDIVALCNRMPDTVGEGFLLNGVARSNGSGS